ncbi:MAG: orotidine-5'-phosphate decarboxylase [Desulfobaccales bacterium]|nr:orotidine-5'-phosphate decarboxylase [Desulfobaccales bacterium]
MNPKDRLIFPLDVPDKDTARRYVDLLREEVGLFKVGLELFMAEGPVIMQELANEVGPNRFFLDLKFHDIPSTMHGAITTILHGITLTTIHCDQGLEALKKMVASLGGDFKILAVTVLTSISSEDLLTLGYDRQYAEDPTQLVLLKAKLAQEAGCAGVVCSGQEVKAVKKECGQDFLVVCPGIRPAWGAVAGDDQKRIVTPYEAIKNGADYIVVGRPIRTAPDRVAAARQVVAEIAAGMKD